MDSVFLVAVGHPTLSLPDVSPPLGLLCLAGYLRREIPDVRLAVVDQRATRLSTDKIVRQALTFKPDVVGFSLMTPSAYLLPPLVEELRKALPKALLVVGGPHVSSFGQAALAECGADAAVVGEGEAAFERVVRVCRDRCALADIPGLLWRDGDGSIRQNEGAFALLEDLDSLPFPAYDLIDLGVYSVQARNNRLPVRRYLSLFTSRGCPYRCIFCHGIFGKRFRAQSAAKVAEDIEYAVRHLHVNDIEILDDIFNCDRARVTELSEILNRRGIKVGLAFPNGIRADRLDGVTVEALVEAGMYYTAIALESASPRIQKVMHKSLDIGMFLSACDLLTARKVFTHGLAMLGFPTETEEEMRLTIDVMVDSRLHTASFATVLPFPNTEIYEYAARHFPEKIKSLKYASADFACARFNMSDVPDERFFVLQREAWRRLYLKPSRMWRIVRDYPDRLRLPRYLPMYLARVSKGLISHA